MSQTIQINLLYKNLYQKLNSIFDLTSFFDENSPTQLYTIDQHRKLSIELIENTEIHNSVITEKQDNDFAEICYTFTDKTGTVIESTKYELVFDRQAEEIHSISNQTQDSQQILEQLNEILKPIRI